VVVTHKLEIGAGAMRIVSGSFPASNVCLNEVQRSLSHIPSLAQPALGASSPSDARPAFRSSLRLSIGPRRRHKPAKRVKRVTVSKASLRRHPRFLMFSNVSASERHCIDRATRDHSCRWTFPSFMTKRTSSMTRMSSSGLPATATRSARLPTAMTPRSSTPRRSAA